MNLASLEALVSALNTAGVRFLVAGGLAVGAHGHPRFTMDVDLVVQLRADNIVAAFHALAGLGYKPLVPVTAEAFSDNALKGNLAPGLPVRFVSIPTLIRMKELVGRPRDLDDIQHLRWILNDRKQDEPGK